VKIVLDTTILVRANEHSHGLARELLLGIIDSVAELCGLLWKRINLSPKTSFPRGNDSALPRLYAKTSIAIRVER